MQQRDAESKNRGAILKQQILSLVSHNVFIDSKTTVVNHITDVTDLEPKEWEIAKIMKETLGM